MKTAIQALISSLSCSPQNMYSPFQKTVVHHPGHSNGLHIRLDWKPANRTLTSQLNHFTSTLSNFDSCGSKAIRPCWIRGRYKDEIFATCRLFVGHRTLSFGENRDAWTTFIFYVTTYFVCWKANIVQNNITVLNCYCKQIIIYTWC